MARRRRLPKKVAYAIRWPGGHTWTLDRKRAALIASENDATVTEVEVPSAQEDTAEQYMRRWFRKQRGEAE